MGDEYRTQGYLPWSSVDRRLRSMREIWVATADADARPHAVPVWFWWDGEAVTFTTKASSRKAQNLAGQSEVVLLNGDGADPIIVEGRVEQVDDRGELERLDAAYAEKYVAPESGERATIFVEGDVALRVRPRRVQAWSYANVGTRTVWRFYSR
jgi:nitroimidazol reductase NimA-like FMN-containing flavoprotein (pyridoxamine 5'-phosphate oxidase superfamily)